MTSILITGGNRGLGLNLVKKLLEHEDPPEFILATYRDQSTSEELLALAEDNPTLKPLQLEMTDIASFEDFAEEVKAIVGDNGLNVLWNNAGVHTHKDSLDEVTVEDYMHTYMSNLVGPVFLTRALLPLIQQAADVNEDQPMSIKRAAILNMSSSLGSVTLRFETKHYSYRESKAAINTFTRNLQYDLEGSGILVLPIHPGWVQTDLGGAEAALSIEESVSGLINVLYGLDESQNGLFLQWDGQALPW